VNVFICSLSKNTTLTYQYVLAVLTTKLNLKNPKLPTNEKSAFKPLTQSQQLFLFQGSRHRLYFPMGILIAVLTSAISLSFFKGRALFLSSDLSNEYFMTFLPGSLNWQLASEAVAAGLRSAKGVQSNQRETEQFLCLALHLPTGTAPVADKRLLTRPNHCRLLEKFFVRS
jgi:hypothetical protein